MYYNQMAISVLFSFLKNIEVFIHFYFAQALEWIKWYYDYFKD